jgi:hypothetical protein
VNKVNDVATRFTEYCLNLSNDKFVELFRVPKNFTNLLIQHWKAHEKTRLGAPGKLEPDKDILLFLIHLRHYPTDHLLGSVFRTCKQTANGIRSWTLCDFIP